MEQESENKESGCPAEASKADVEAAPTSQLSNVDQIHDQNAMRRSTKTEDQIEASEKTLLSEVNNDVSIPENNRVETKNPVKASGISSSPKRNGGAENHVNASDTPFSENSNKTENPVEASNALLSKNGGGNSIKATNRAEPSIKSTPKSLKAKSKVVKKSLVNKSLPVEKAKGESSTDRNLQGNSSKNEDINGVNPGSGEGIPQTNAANEQTSEKSQETNKKRKKIVKRKIVKRKVERKDKNEDANSKGPNSGGGDTETIVANEQRTETSLHTPKVEENSKNEGGNTKNPNSGEEIKQEIVAADNFEKGQGSNKKRKKIAGPKQMQQRWKVEKKQNDEDAKNLSLGEDKRQKNVAAEQPVEKGKEIGKKQEKINGKKSQQKWKAEDKPGHSDWNAMNQRYTEKDEGKEKNQQNKKKKGKLGGLIFMCSAKTKPDCFRYNLMGMSLNKKDVVLAIKPGLKLFLYDFDLKLMYGIYEASSRGGMKLEPKAFGGAFPVQVRFSVWKDCFPLPESTFKKAIKENYNAKNKFKLELTIQQAKKLSALFRPAVFQPIKTSAVPLLAPHMTSIREREAYEAVREPRSRPDRNVEHRGYPAREVVATKRIKPPQDLYLSEPRSRSDRDVDGRSYLAYEVVATKRNESPRGLYLSEREYRTYGLQRERRQLSPSRSIPPPVDPYIRDRKGDRLHGQPNSIYRDDLPVQRVSAYVDHRYSGYGRDPYLAYRHDADAYILPQRREEVSTSYYADNRRAAYLDAADPIQRRETDQLDRLYSRYAPDISSNHRQVNYQGANTDSGHLSVSSRYSFGSPSMPYR